MEQNERNSNIELLRIVLIFMVIALHFNLCGGIQYSENNQASRFILKLIESLSICAVNCFMIISGYFLSYNKKVKLGKILDLFLIVIFYRLADYIVSIVFFDAAFSVSKLVGKFIPVNYFAILYCVSYLFSPFISKMLDSLNEKNQRLLLVLLTVVFILWPTVIDGTMELIPSMNLNSISSISTSGNLAGYSIVQFMVCLIFGMCLRRSGKEYKTGPLLAVYFSSVLIMTLANYKFNSVYYYCSVFTLTSAVSLFLLFNKLTIQSRAVNYISKSVFAIFCIHTQPVMNELWCKYIITENHIAGSTGKTLLWFVIATVGMFAACLVIDLIVRNTFGILKNKLCSKCPVIVNVED